MIDKAEDQFRNRLVLPLAVTIKRVFTLNPKFFQGYNNLGWISLKQLNYSRAEKLLKKATTLDPTNVEAYFNLGFILTKQKKF